MLGRDCHERMETRVDERFRPDRHCGHGLVAAGDGTDERGALGVVPDVHQVVLDAVVIELASQTAAVAAPRSPIDDDACVI